MPIIIKFGRMFPTYKVTWLFGHVILQDNVTN